MTTEQKATWTWGDKRRLAEALGITPQYLDYALKGGASKKLALRIEKAALEMGYFIPAEDVLMPDRSINPLVGKPRKG